MKVMNNNISQRTCVQNFTRMLAGAALCLFSSTSGAALLGVQPGFPQSSFDNQGTTVFNSPNLSINASFLSFKFVNSDIPYEVFGSITMNAKIDAACTLMGNDPNPELTLVGDVYDLDFNPILSGTLLTGEIVAVGIQPAGPGTTAIDFRFNSAAGALVSSVNWPAGKDIGATMTVENSSFVDCAQAFSGGAKGAIGPIEPLTPPVCSDKGAHSQGYWKNHLGSWPVNSIIIGGVTYDVRQARNLMKRPPKGDQTWTLYRQLIAAMLNVDNGTCPTCIQTTIDAANQWLFAHLLGSSVKASSSAWQDTGEDLKDTLEAYNQGMLCAPRDRDVEAGGDEEHDDNGPGHDRGDHSNCRSGHH